MRAIDGESDEKGSKRDARVNTILPQWESHEDFVVNHGAKPGVSGMIAYFNPGSSSRLLYLDEGHPLLQKVVDACQYGRSVAKHDEIRELCKDTFVERITDTIHAGHLFNLSTKSAGVDVETLGAKWVNHIHDPRTLTAVVADLPTMVQLTNNKFSGRVGFKKIETKDQVA